MTKPGVAVVTRKQLDRPVDESRYGGLVRPDKTVRWAVEALAPIVRWRGTGKPPTGKVLESFRELAKLLAELGWDDLAASARQEELRAYRMLEADQRRAYDDRVDESLAALRGNLVDLGRYEEALAVVEEQLVAGRGESVREARVWQTVILDRLGRHEEAVASAEAAVAEIRGRLARRDGRIDLELCHALAAYAEQLDHVGRVGEAVDATVEVLAYWRGRADSRYEFARTVDELSDRLARSGRPVEAFTVITEAWPRLRRHDGYGDLADVWHNLGLRLTALGYPKKALAAANQAVKRCRILVEGAREQLRSEEQEEWDDDHRYTEAHLWERHRRNVARRLERVHRAERDLSQALVALAACLRQLDRPDQATAAAEEAASLVASPTTSSVLT